MRLISLSSPFTPEVPKCTEILEKTFGGNTTRKVAICDDLLVTLLTFVTEWYVLSDEFSNFFIGGK
jgi:hypothetical protein